MSTLDGANTDDGSERAALDAARERVGAVVAERYHLVALLGAGGMGAVYEAENTWTGRRVAIKILRPELALRADIVARFLREARAASQLRHPHIVDVMDMGRDAHQTLYIVQELLEGSDLRARLRAQGRFTPQEALAVIVPVMDALEAAHAQGIVHRDIKPENIFLARGSGGEVVPKLIDFGISKMLGDNRGAPLFKTRTGATLGTPYYMSPEQARADTSLDARTDVWSVGAVLFELLSGHRPFDAASFSMLLVKIITEDAPRLEDLVPEVPRALAETVRRALERDRDARFPTMHAFRQSLAPPPAMQGPSPPTAQLPTASPEGAAMDLAPTQEAPTPPASVTAPPRTPAPEAPADTLSSTPSSTPASWNTATRAPSRRSRALVGLSTAALLAGAGGLLVGRAREPPRSPIPQVPVPERPQRRAAPRRTDPGPQAAPPPRIEPAPLPVPTERIAPPVAAPHDAGTLHGPARRTPVVRGGHPPPTRAPAAPDAGSRPAGLELAPGDILRPLVRPYPGRDGG